MFWKKPPKDKSPAAKLSREELIAQAKANVAAAKAEIGQETIDKMRAILMAQEQQKASKALAAPKAPPSKKPAVAATPAEQARRLIETMDKAKVADYIRTLHRDDD